jgi:hypothetical protein
MISPPLCKERAVLEPAMVVVPPTHLPVRGAALVKSARQQLDIVNAYAELGSYRAAAELCGTTHKTTRRIIQCHREGTLRQPPGRPGGRATAIR